MKKICIVGYNYGLKYQSFIPLYIYSILSNYPGYSVLIFSDCGLEDNVKKQLELIEDIGDFEVVENYDINIGTNKYNLPSGVYKRMARWLFYDKRFDNYETIYIGDIDIFVCKEQKGIYEQHLKHCETLGLPYSNYVRFS